nr:MAG TPA: hypothetical protein [Caudoviricetes sp.]
MVSLGSATRGSPSALSCLSSPIHPKNNDNTCH